LLPLKSASFGRAADAVRRGFLAAAKSRTLSVRVYECDDESAEIIALYRQAVAGGARAVAGPLTRNGVAALAGSPGIAVPTLALNIAESKGAEKLYFFGLTAETEARQIAQLAAIAGLRKASIVSNGTPLSRRLSQAFAEEWKIRGGSIVKEILYQDDPTVLADIPAIEGNMVFLAANAESAHLIRPYLDIALPVYATSQLFNGNADVLTNYDLNDVRFLDMPWLLQPDHPAVMVYPRASPPLEADMERLYALGIDAFRLLQIMLDNNYRTSLPLDGVTGSIRLNAHRQFQREAIPALFRQGRGLTPEELAAQEAALATAKAAVAASGISPASTPAPLR
jgi:outer membrane PBP1 activator LpoA protein